MNPCPQCHGTGVAPTHDHAVRGAALGKLPPFGREVEQAVRGGTLRRSGVDIFHKPNAANEHHAAVDAWEMAARIRSSVGPGAAMVLPPGESVASFRWPAIPIKFEDAPAVVFWAYQCTADEERAFGEALVAAGFDVVDVRGGPTGPLRFVAE